MKLGVFAVSMPDYDVVPGMEMLSQLGYDGIELRVIDDKGDRNTPSFWSGNRMSITPSELLARGSELKAKAKSLGLAIPALGAYTSCHDTDASIETYFRAAVACGATNVRIGPGGYDLAKGAFQKQMEAAHARYVQIADLAARHKVRALVETHMGQLAPSIRLARELLDGIDPRHVGIMWDPGNQVVEGGEVYAMALDMAGEYLGEVHAKNMSFVQRDPVAGRTPWQAAAAPLRDGIVNWPDVIAALKKIGYAGWIHFEDFSTSRPLDERLKDNLAWFRELIG